MKEEEKCIMPESPLYSTKRFTGSERHEVFEGYSSKNRQYSIEDGLVIFVTPYEHRIDSASVHKDPNNERWIEVRKIAEKTWCEYYNKTIEDFIQKYGKNYL